MKNVEIEIPIKSSEARVLLGVGVSFFSAVKSVMGIKSRKRVMLSEIRRWLAANPEFRESDVYHRPDCICGQCKKKRADSKYKPRGRGVQRLSQGIGALG